MVFRKRTGTQSTLESNDAEKLIPKRRGLFGRKHNVNDDRSSDSDAGPFEKKMLSASTTRRGRSASPVKKTRSASPFKRRQKDDLRETKPERSGSLRALSPFKRRGAYKDEKDAGTPPITPEKGTGLDPPLQVKVVTVKSSSSPAKGKADRGGEDDDSVMSDLTDNRTYKRLVDYKQALAREQEEAAAAAAVKAEVAVKSSEMPSIPEDKVAYVKARLEKVQAAQENDEDATVQSEHTDQPGGADSSYCRDRKDDTNPMTYLFGIMEHACTSGPPEVKKSYSFVPEWGMAPSTDERDHRSTPINPTETDGDDEGTEVTHSLIASQLSYEPLPAHAPGSGHPTKDEIHENFEMVLEDLQSTEDRLAEKRQLQQQRNWMGAMSFRKNQANKPGSPQSQPSGANVPPETPQMPIDADAAPGTPSEPTDPTKSKNRDISPHAVEEEKKEDDTFDSESGSSGGGGGLGARMGSKLLRSFRRLKRPKAELAPVTEEEEDGRSDDHKTNGLEVRVPYHKKSLTEKDLIGDNVVQDIYRDLEASLESTAAKSPETIQSSQQDTNESSYILNPTERPSSPMSQSTRSGTVDEDEDTIEADGNNMLTSFMSLLSGGVREVKDLPPEVRDIPDVPTIPQSKSWVDQFQLTMSEDSTVDNDAQRVRRQQQPSAMDRKRSAPATVQGKMKKKQFWREAIDPKSGRPYYYHRVTREVTWKKPQEFVEEEQKKLQVVDEEKEAERRLLSVLSDGDLAAAAEREAKPKSSAAGPMRKKDARDFDPRVWAIKEQVVKLLETMAPPDGASVEQILKQYEGREELLLQQLNEMKEARPFDEPVASDAHQSDDEKQPVRSKAEPARSKSAPRRRPQRLGAARTRSNDKGRNLKVDNEATKIPENKQQAHVAAETKKREPKKSESKVGESSKTAAVAENKSLARKRTSSPQPRISERATQPAPILKPTPRAAPDPEGTDLKSLESPEQAAERADNQGSDMHTPQPLSSRVRTAGSGVTKVSEKTEQIKNTSKKQNTLNTLGEVRSVGSDATSLSSTGIEPRAAPVSYSPGPIPGKISAPRTRELMVEEFSSNERHYKAETFEKKRNVRAGRFGTTGTRRRKPFTTPHMAEGGDESTRGTDSVSAISMEDSKPYMHSLTNSGTKRGGVDDARKRALDNAIAREDWDLAAAISDAMRTVKARPPSQPPTTEWRQSELDRFISQNDWDAVANYIAHVRAKAKQEGEPRSQPPRGVVSRTRELVSAKRSSRRRPRSRSPLEAAFDEEDELMGNPKKRFGARSQLQHNEIHSESSWESESTYSSDDYSTSSYSEPSARRDKNRYRYASKHSRPIQNGGRPGKPKEFAC